MSCRLSLVRFKCLKNVGKTAASAITRSSNYNLLMWLEENHELRHLQTNIYVRTFLKGNDKIVLLRRIIVL